MNKYHSLKPFLRTAAGDVCVAYNISCTNMSLQKLLNKTRANVSMAFQSLQKMSSHTIEEYMSRVVSDLKISYGDVVN